MRVILRMMIYPLVRPSLGLAAVSIGLIYFALFLIPALPRRYVPLPLCVAPILLFWISLRVLLKVGRPPEKILGSIVVALLLLNLLLGLAGVVKVIWSITELP